MVSLTVTEMNISHHHPLIMYHSKMLLQRSISLTSHLLKFSKEKQKKMTLSYFFLPTPIGIIKNLKNSLKYHGYEIC